MEGKLKVITVLNKVKVVFSRLQITGKLVSASEYL